jgi:hypothetical protein
VAPQPPLPPKPPGPPPPLGGQPRSGAAGLGKRPTVPVASTRSALKLARPPWVPFALCGLLVIALIYYTFGVSRDNTPVHFVVSLFGMFGSIAILGWFRQELNVRRSTGSFSEWPGPWESTKYMWLLVTLAWLGGALNMYFAVYELARPK